MLSTQDLLNIVLIFTAIIFVGGFLYLTFIIVATLKSIKRVADSINSTTKDLAVVSDSLKVGAMSIVGKLLGYLRGGEARGKN
jgi:uncharacterized membrane protein